MEKRIKDSRMGIKGINDNIGVGWGRVPCISHFFEWSWQSELILFSFLCGYSADILSSPEVLTCPCMKMCLGWLRALSNITSEILPKIEREALGPLEFPR